MSSISISPGEWDVSSLTFGLLVTYILISPFDELAPNITNAVILMIAGAVAVHILNNGGQIKLLRKQFYVVLGLALILVFWMLSTIQSASVYSDLVIARTMLLVVIISLASITSLTSHRRIHQTWLAFSLMAAFVGVATVLESTVGLPLGGRTLPARSFLGLDFGLHRAVGIHMGFISLGIILITALVYLVAQRVVLSELYPAAPSRAKLVNTVLLAGVVGGLYVSQSRSTWGGVVFSMAVVAVAYVAKSDGKFRRHALIAAGAGSAIAAVAILPTILSELLWGISPAGTTSRIQQYRLAIEIIVEYPLFGIGWETFKPIYSQWIIHNLFLRMGVSLGLPALLLWVFVYLELFSSGWDLIKNRGRFQWVMGVVVMGVLTGVLVELMLGPAFNDYLAIVFGLCLGSYNVLTPH